MIVRVENEDEVMMVRDGESVEVRRRVVGVVVEVVGWGDVKVRMIMVGRCGWVGEGDVVGWEGGEWRVLGEIVVLVGEEGCVLVGGVGYEVWGWGDVEGRVWVGVDGCVMVVDGVVME